MVIVYVYIYIFLCNLLRVYHISILNKLGFSGYITPNDDISCLFKWYYRMVCVYNIYIYIYTHLMGILWDICNQLIVGFVCK